MTGLPGRKNLVICICDQLRAHEMGCYGHPVVRTPNLDRLAEAGTRFEHAVTNAPVCMAARSVLLSGQHNRTCTGGVGNVIYPSKPGDFNMPEYPERGRPHLKDPTLAEVLRSAGYRTSVIGKWHIHSWPDEIGFDDYLIPRVHHCHRGQCFTRDGGEEFVPDGYSVDFEAAEVERYLAERGKDRTPFFLYYSISPPHCPVADAPEATRNMYDPAQVVFRPNVDESRPLPRADYWWRVYRYDFRYYNLKLPYTERVPEGYGLRELIAEYWGMTTWMDTAAGRMLRALDAAGLAEDTVVLFTSDHGDNLGSLGRVQKGSPNEESVRIPMLFRGPACGAGRVVDDRVGSLVDVMPTCLDLLGLPVPGHLHGRSLAPALGGARTPEGESHAVVQYFEQGGGAAVRTPGHTLGVPIRDGRMGDAPDYFWDLAADPFQLTNRARTALDDPEGRRLAELLKEWDRDTPWMEGAP